MGFIYDEISTKLSTAVSKGYKGGITAIVKLNKKTILKLAEPNPLFEISFTDIDKKLIEAFKREAFQVAGVLEFECEEKLKAMLVSILNGTHPYLVKNPESDIKSLWQDEAYNILADYIEVPDMPPPAYLNTNLKTAVDSAYYASQWERVQEVKDIYIAIEYMTREDSHVRKDHEKLDRMIFYTSDPIWNIIWFPNGWGCRCYPNYLTREELASKDQSKILQLEDSARREEIIKIAHIDKNFARNAAQKKSIWGKWLNQKYKDMPDSVVEEIKKRASDG